MADIQDILDLLKDIKRRVADIEESIVVSGAQVHVSEGLSDISVNLGLVTAGEFRSGKGIPGKGFSGVRMVWPTVTYGGQAYNIVGVENDEIQFGLRSSDGVAVLGAGSIDMGSSGIRINSAGVENWDQRPFAVYNPTWDSDPTLHGMEWTLWQADLANADAGSPGTRVGQAIISLRAPTTDGSTDANNPTMGIEVQAYKYATSDASSDGLTKFALATYVKDQLGRTGYAYLPNLYTADHPEGGKTMFEFVGASTDMPAEFYIDFKKSNTLTIIDASTDAGTEQGWLEVRIGSEVGYIRVYSAK